MGGLALLCAIAGAASVAVPGAGKYLAVGLGIVAVGFGVLAYRRGDPRPGARLAGAAGAAVGGIALLFGAAKVALTLMAIERLAAVLQ
jgi:hypothetical protein